MKLLIYVFLLAAVQGLLAAQQPTLKVDETAVLHCQGDAIVLSFYRRYFARRVGPPLLLESACILFTFIRPFVGARHVVASMTRIRLNPY